MTPTSPQPVGTPEPATVQRRARELRERLSAAQFLEVVGVASLANAFCRLGAVVSAEA